MKPRIGFVGLGNIGFPMCRRLLESGYEVLVYDVNPGAVSRLEDTPAEPADSLKALAAADVVLLSLPGSDVVEEVVLGEGGLAEGLSSGKVLIDTSSSRPSSTRDLAKKLAESGVEMLDAPVSGGVLRAEEGKLAVMVGGREEVFERWREVLESFGEKIFHVGDHGAGHLVKSLNNLLSATTLASAAEAVILAEKAGVDVHPGVIVGARKGEWLEPSRLMTLFRASGPERHYKILDTSVIIDGRLKLHAPTWRSAGWKLVQIGRATTL